MRRPPVSIVVAALMPKYGIGVNGGLPWRLRKEMKYFKLVTTQTVDPAKRNVVVMGRKTWESIPLKFRPLPGRLNVILSRDPSTLRDKMSDELIKNNSGTQTNLMISRSISEALKQINKEMGLDKIENVFIIGGGEIYNECLKDGIVDQVLLTQISSDEQVEMDTFLNIDLDNWTKMDIGKYWEAIGLSGFEVENSESDFKYQFTLYSKRP